MGGLACNKHVDAAVGYERNVIGIQLPLGWPFMIKPGAIMRGDGSVLSRLANDVEDTYVASNETMPATQIPGALMIG